MEYLLYGIIGMSTLLFVVSFFLPNRMKRIETDLEELSYQIIKDSYQLKKRMKVLEEELLVEHSPSLLPPPKSKPNEIIINQVLSLYRQGVEIEKISAQSTLSKEEVKDIIDNVQQERGLL